MIRSCDLIIVNLASNVQKKAPQTMAQVLEEDVEVYF
jgi:hypothetical protein